MPLPLTEEEKSTLTHQLYALFTQHGSEGISMNETAKQIGLSKATVYKYFNSKEDIVRDMVGEIISHLAEVEFTTEEGLDGILKSLADIYAGAVIVAAYSSSRFIADLENNYPDMFSDLAAAIDNIRKQFELFYEKAVQKGFCRNVPTSLVGEQVMQMLPVIITSQFLDRHNMTLLEILREYYRLLLCLLINAEYEAVMEQESTYSFVNIVVDRLRERFLTDQPL